MDKQNQDLNRENILKIFRIVFKSTLSIATTNYYFLLTMLKLMHMTIFEFQIAWNEMNLQISYS